MGQANKLNNKPITDAFPACGFTRLLPGIACMQQQRPGIVPTSIKHLQTPFIKAAFINPVQSWMLLICPPE